jgi:hypothetical protein
MGSSLDYFQMVETTSRRCLSLLTKGLVCCSALADNYLKKPMVFNAQNSVALHQDAHNIPGMMGSLDKTKVHWKNCPTTRKGQFQGHKSLLVFE